MILLLTFAVEANERVPAPSTDPVIKLATKGSASCEQVTSYRVSSLADDGSRGTLRHAIHVAHHNEKDSQRKSCRHVTFDVHGEIRLLAPLFIRSDFVTIDGCSTRQPGITISQTPGNPRGIVIDGTKRHTHDVLLQCLRFRGVQDTLKRHKVGEAVLSIDGDCTRLGSSCPPDWQDNDPVGGVSRIALDQLVYAYATDKLTLWGKIKNASITRSFFYKNPMALLISFYNGPIDLEKSDISIRANVFSQNNERNPQLRGWINKLDFHQNIISHWDAFPPLADHDGYPGDGYGIRIKNVAGEKSVNADIVNNVFIPGSLAKDRALIYGIQSGRDMDEGGPVRCLTQGEEFKDSNMGELYISGNYLPDDNCDQYSTIRHAAPAFKEDNPLTAAALCKNTSRNAGVPFATHEEEQIIQAVEANCLQLTNVKKQ